MQIRILIAMVFASFSWGCNGFSNEGLIDLYGENGNSSSITRTDLSPSPVVSTPISLDVVSNASGLPEAHYGMPYSQQFSVANEASVCWRVEEGTLPEGLKLDSATGFLGGRVQAEEAGYSQFRVAAFSPCEGSNPTAFGVGEEMVLVHHGKCLWDQDCAADETCREDGTCRKEVSGTCGVSVRTNMRFEAIPAVKPGSLVVVENVEVVFNGIPPENSPCSLGDKMLVVAVPGHHNRTFCYRMPGELLIPISVEEVIDLRLLTGHFQDRYAMVRVKSAEQGWRWAAYSGHLDATHLWSRLCGPHKDCPFLSQFSLALLSGCEQPGACAPTRAGLRLKTQAKVLLPGQQVAWGTGSNGEALYQLYLADAYVQERCSHGTLAGGMTYLLLEGAMPHPLVHVPRDEILLDSIPSHITFDGGASIAAGMNADDSSYIHEYLWSVEKPLGNPRIAPRHEGNSYTLDAYVAGAYFVGLEVTDYKTSLKSRQPATARVLVRPASALHIELIWDDPKANLDLHLSPPEASGGWAHSVYPPLSESMDPAWTRIGGSSVASLVAQPEGLPLELLRGEGGLVTEGDYLLGVDQSIGADEPVKAMVRVYLYGKEVVGGSFQVTIEPNAFVPLARINVVDGQLVSLLP